MTILSSAIQCIPNTKSVAVECSTADLGEPIVTSTPFKRKRVPLEEWAELEDVSDIEPMDSTYEPEVTVNSEDNPRYSSYVLFVFL